MPCLSVGEVGVVDDSHVQHFRSLCENNQDWVKEYAKNNVFVWTKLCDKSFLKMIKVNAVLQDIPATVLFDTLMDSEYRKRWDKNMIEGYEICHLNPNNDIGYYALRSITPLRNRDFVMQRSWLETNSEYYIISHSVFHKAMPPRKNYIRAVTYMLGYLIQVRGSNCCELTYLAHCDPRGRLPLWAVNKATTFVAPRVISRLTKACQKYNSWKKSNSPDRKPWSNPEQITSPSLNWTDISAAADFDITVESTVDESTLTDTNNGEEDFDADDINGSSN